MFFLIEANEEPTELTFKGKSIKLTKVEECWTCGLIMLYGRACPVPHND